MSQENVERARLGIEHFLRTGELPQEYLDPEFEIHEHDVPDAATYRGRDGFLQWVAHWAEAWTSFAYEPEEFIDAGDKVVVVIRITARGRASGVSVERLDGMVLTPRDDRLVRVDYYGSRAEALNAVGLAD
jgi:ketosteroid isomerase-like protein